MAKYKFQDRAGDLNKLIDLWVARYVIDITDDGKYTFTHKGDNLIIDVPNRTVETVFVTENRISSSTMRLMFNQWYAQNGYICPKPIE